jgi:polysaccharide biosynthesis/export protein
MVGITHFYKAYKIFSIYSFLLFFSCSQRNLTYLSDLQAQAVYTENITNSIEPIMQPNDLLEIDINSLSPESNALFSKGVLQTGGNGNNLVASNRVSAGYLVDKNGFVAFPVIGKVKLAGLTKEEATIKLTELLGKYVRQPIVNIKYLNFKVTVIGEVKNPSSFAIPAEKVNILEAIGLAGDMTDYGKRESVLILREQDGKRLITRVNMNNKEVLNSPYFYLKQNDIVYVEPDKSKLVRVNLGRQNLQYWLAIGSVVTLILTRFL